MATAATMDGSPIRRRGLCIFLAIIATIELVDALTSIQTIFAERQTATGPLRLAETLNNIRLAITPLIVAAAVVFAAMGNARRTILALAVFNLMTWFLDGIPTIVLHGMSLSLDYGGLEHVFLYIITPIAALAAGALALKNRRLALAGLLVSLSTLFRWVGVVIFIFAVVNYGF
jgi:hypothetical protein